jgi:hypothetical protein
MELLLFSLRKSLFLCLLETRLDLWLTFLSRTGKRHGGISGQKVPETSQILLDSPVVCKDKSPPTPRHVI